MVYDDRKPLYLLTVINYNGNEYRFMMDSAEYEYKPAGARDLYFKFSGLIRLGLGDRTAAIKKKQARSGHGLAVVPQQLAGDDSLLGNCEAKREKQDDSEKKSCFHLWPPCFEAVKLQAYQALA
jgi:hypothetical protein